VLGIGLVLDVGRTTSENFDPIAVPALVLQHLQFLSLSGIISKLHLPKVFDHVRNRPFNMDVGHQSVHLVEP